MRVLVSPASKHGGTAEIGRTIARILRTQGIDVDVAQPQDIHDVSRYEGFVLGSALYMGACDHRMFSGRLELSRLGRTDRFVAQWVGARDGDYREWDEIEAWASGIAMQLLRHSSTEETAL